MFIVVPEYGFPARYNENDLVLLPRDPHCIFAYWEFSDEQMELVSRKLGFTWGEVPLTLRVYDLTGLDGEEVTHSYFERTVHALANNYYVQELKDNSAYRVDLGIVTTDGLFVVLLRSNVVQTPRASVADGSGVIMADLLDRLRETNRQPETETSSSEGYYAIRNPKEEG